jgi:hypothetical protein
LFFLKTYFPSKRVAEQAASLYNNLAKPFTTVGADLFYSQTSGPRPPKHLQAYLKLAAEDKSPKKLEKKFTENFLIFFSEFFSMKTRSVAEHSASLYKPIQNI